MLEYILALYDFASKQEYIYKTTKIKEISGASALLAGMYREFAQRLQDNGLKITYDIETEFCLDGFDDDGVVLYDGGGNWMVLYKDKETYIKANKILSAYLIEHCPGLSMIVSCVQLGDDFGGTVKALFKENTKQKNFYPASDLPAVTPMTQIDPQTFLPVVHKETKRYVADESLIQESLSADRYVKQRHYTRNKADNLDGLEGLAAVIYIDGNSMGEKLKACTADVKDIDEAVKNLRTFSKNVNEAFVTAPVKAIRETLKGSGFRQVIGGGDEITLICEAKDAWRIICTYFETLGQAKGAYSSCAGIAVFHAGTPFNVVYEVAEAACESAKAKAHLDPGNYVDFYYCHGSVTADFDTLRKSEQQHATGRPYAFEEAKAKFEQYTPLLNMAGRANVKALGTAAQLGRSAYIFEVNRVNGHLATKKTDMRFSVEDESEMKLVYDMSEFFDLWFIIRKEKDEKKEEQV